MTLANRKVLNAAIGSMTALVAVIVACLLIAGDDTRALQPREPTQTPRIPAPATSEVVLPPAKSAASRPVSEADHQELLKKVERLEALIAESAGLASPSKIDERIDDQNGAESLSLEEQEQRVLSQFRAQVETLETVLHSEFVDEEWAKPAMIALSDAFEEQADEGIEMLEVDCRGTLCRLSLAFDPERAEESFKNLQRILPWEGEVFFHLADVDSGEAVVYFARENQQLPRAE